MIMMKSFWFLASIHFNHSMKSISPTLWPAALPSSAPWASHSDRCFVLVCIHRSRQHVADFDGLLFCNFSNQKQSERFHSTIFPSEQFQVTVLALSKAVLVVFKQKFQELKEPHLSLSTVCHSASETFKTMFNGCRRPADASVSTLPSLSSSVCQIWTTLLRAACRIRPPREAYMGRPSWKFERPNIGNHPEWSYLNFVKSRRAGRNWAATARVELQLRCCPSE